MSGNPEMILAVVVVLAGIAMLAVLLRVHRVDREWRGVRASLTTVFLGFSLLTSAVIPAGAVRTTISVVFLGAAALMLVSEIRDEVKRRGTPSM